MAYKSVIVRKKFLHDSSVCRTFVWVLLNYKKSYNKSPGIDGICSKLLKIAAPIICSSLAYICNLSLFMSEFPLDWKAAKVTPIHKSGDKANVDNYRPISVLSIVSKIMERAVHNQLYEYLRVRTVAKRHMGSSMFTATFILVSCVKLP